MQGLIEDLLTLAQSDIDEMAVEPVDLEQIARSCWSVIGSRDATLTVEADRRVLANRPQLRQLLENLLGNAVEHGSTSPRSQAREDAAGTSSGEPSVATAPEDAVEHGSTSPASNARQDAVENGGKGVTVTVGLVEDGFYIADDGPGIPPDERDRVLEPGWTTNPDGTGLGLNIVCEIAQAHEWDIDVTESAAGGARFEFSGVRTAVGDESVAPSS